MRKARVVIIGVLIAILCAVLLLGAKRPVTKYYETTSEIVTIPDAVGMSAYVENSLIYEALDANGFSFFRQDFDTNKTIKIGTIPNVILVDKSRTIMDNKYYFYASVPKGNEFGENLYSIDLKNNKIAAVESDFSDSKLIPVNNMNGKIIALKSDMYEENGYSQTYLYEYNPENNIGRKVLSKRIVLNDFQGDAFVAFTCDNDKLYAVVDNGGQKKDISLEVYDKNYKLIKKHPINGLDILFGQMIMDIKVKGEYIYFIGMSGHSAIGKMLDNSIQVIYEDNYVEPFDEPLKLQTTEWYFFKRESNTFFTLNLVTGEFVKEERVIKDNYLNYYAMISKNGRLIHSLVDTSNSLIRKDSISYHTVLMPWNQ